MKATEQDFPVQFPVALLVIQTKSENFSVLKFELGELIRRGKLAILSL